LGWKPIFALPVYARAILGSLDWHRRHDRWALYAYALTPNHLHAIVKPLGDRSTSDVLQSFGSFTAHEILGCLKVTAHLPRPTVTKRWRLVEDRADYAYSSACFYDKGIMPIVEVDDVREWL
jgi:hypothetical protein